MADRGAGTRQALGKASIFAALLLLTLAAFPRGDVYDYLVQTDEEWRHETLVAPFDYPVYKDPETLRMERAQVRYRTPPFFREVPGAVGRVLANRDTVARQLDRILRLYVSLTYNRERGRLAQAAEDSIAFHQLRRDALLKVTPEQWRRLTRSYVEDAPELLGTPDLLDNTRRLDRQLLTVATEYASRLVTTGVFDVPRDSIYADHITIRNEQERIDRTRPRESLYGLDEAYDLAEQHFKQRYATDPDRSALALAFFRAVMVPSLEYLREETRAELERKERRVLPTQGGVRQGEMIVRKGQRITPEIRQKLISLKRAEDVKGGNVIVWKTILGQLLLTLTTYLLFFLYLFLLRRRIFEDNRRVLLVALIFAGIIGLYAIAIRVPNVPMLAVPVAIASVLLTVMFDSRVGLVGTMTLALLGGGLLSYDYEFTFATIFAGILGVFSVRDIKNRGQFFLSAGLVFLGYVAVLAASWLIFDTSLRRFLSDLLMVGINSFLLIMAYPLLWVFERAFDVTTDLTLLELSDTNRPLLKELSLRAPGTFNHSLQVANLAEAAADAIGANALLTRVGALYHDIGKMLKPEYYVENQRPGENPHDHLRPRMSALIIASHVKEGIELGRQKNLPQRVLRFIPMHHGTTRIEYFYRKAIEQRGPEEAPVQESEFRYPGPRPDAKETGILMLADSVEAASRSLAEPTHKRLETLVEMIFKARMEDDQLDQTDLTFRDLNIIKETFLSMLLGIYHVRPKYPSQKEKPERPQPTGGEGAGAERARSTSADGSSPTPPAREAGEVGPAAVISSRGGSERGEAPGGAAGRPEQPERPVDGEGVTPPAPEGPKQPLPEA